MISQHTIRQSDLCKIYLATVCVLVRKDLQMIQKILNHTLISWAPPQERHLFFTIPNMACSWLSYRRNILEVQLGSLVPEFSWQYSARIAKSFAFTLEKTWGHLRIASFPEKNNSCIGAFARLHPCCEITPQKQTPYHRDGNACNILRLQ